MTKAMQFFPPASKAHDDVQFDELVATHGVMDYQDIAVWLALMKAKFDSQQKYKHVVVNEGETQVYMYLCLSTVPRRVRGQTVTWWQNGKEKDVYDVIIQKIWAKKAGRPFRSHKSGCCLGSPV